MSRGHYNLNRDRYEAMRSRAHAVGQQWFHSVQDRQRALDSITSALSALATEVVRWHERNPAAVQDAALVQWVESDVLPTVQEWNAFAARERASWWVRAATSWDTFMHWHERVRDLRQLARAHDIVLQTPEIEPLPKTIWEKSDEGTGSEIAPWFGIAKVAIGAAITIAGAATLFSVIKEWRKPRTHHHEAQQPPPPGELPAGTRSDGS